MILSVFSKFSKVLEGLFCSFHFKGIRVLSSKKKTRRLEYFGEAYYWVVQLDYVSNDPPLVIVYKNRNAFHQKKKGGG